jgi:diguanylate cyclase (GGDEF)-like protein/PAS domain S-box-containing protein
MSKAIHTLLDKLFSRLRRRLPAWLCARQTESLFSQSLFSQSINALQEGYVVQDRDGVILLCNAAAERLLGVSLDSLAGQSVERLGWRFLRENGDEYPRSQHPSRLALQTGKPQEEIIAGIQTPGAEIVWLSMKAAPVFHAGQTLPYAAVLTFTDITAKRQIEADLQTEREFQQALLESLQSGIVACDAEGILTLFNSAAREFHSLPEQPLPPDQWADHFDLFQPDGVTPLSTQEIPLFRAFGGEIVRDAEMVIAPADAPRRTLLVSGQAIYGSQGQKLGAVVAMHDITARRQIERELSRLAAIVASSEEAIVAATLDGTLVSWNAGAERLYGYAASEMIGQHGSVLLPENESSPVAAILPCLLRGEPTEPVEVVHRRRDGVTLNLALSFSPIYDADGEVIGLSCIACDITARRQAEDALRESETRLRYLAYSAFEGIAVSQDGTVVDANPAFLALYGYQTREEIFGLASECFVVPEARSLIRQKIDSGAEDIYEALCQRRDGSTFSAEVRGRQILWNGRPARATAVRDVTERKAVEDELHVSHRAIRESEARLAEAQRIAKVGSWEYDLADGKIAKISWSGEMFRLLGRDLEAGVPDYEEAMSYYHPEDAPTLKSLMARAAQAGIGYEIDLRGNPRFSEDGLTRWYHRTSEVITDELGRVVRLAGTVAEITERKAMEEALRRSEEALRALMSSAPVILYAADAAGTITLSEGKGLAALGLTPGETVGRSVFEFSDSDSLMQENTRRALAGETVSYDARVGALCLHTELRPQQDADGTVTGMIGVCFDITERAQSEERFRVLFEQSSNAHLLFNDTGIIDCNQAALAMMRGTDKDQLLGIHPALLSPPYQPDGRLSSEKGDEMCALARKNGSHQFEWARLAFDGTEFPVEVTLTVVTLNDQSLLLAVWHDLTERKQAEQQIKDYMVILEFQKSQLEQTNRELEALATTDGLTGLKNHRTFQEKLTEEHSRAVRYQQPLSLLLLDVDHFKPYNDSFGHPAGDAVLRQVAAILGQTARDTDIAARYGGEEFALLLPLTDEDGAMAIAERVRVAVAGGLWEQRPITVSIGVCSVSLDTPTPGSLLSCADKALYQAKEMGRNQVSYGKPFGISGVQSAEDLVH